jgi:hypothetical protein
MFFYIEGMFCLSYIEGDGLILRVLQAIDRKLKSMLDGRSQVSIIRPTSGAVETENSLLINELRSFRQQVLQFIEAKRKLKKRC